MAKDVETFDLISTLAKNNSAAAILTSAERISWLELAARVTCRQQGLQKLGFVPGDFCALYAAPCIAYVEILFAMWSMGIVAVPMNTRLPISPAQKMLDSINCCSVLLDAENPFGNSIKTFHFQDTLTTEHVKAPANLKIATQTPATIFFTSGSTGIGKACLHTIGNHLFSALGSNENIRLAPGDLWLLSLPLYHVSGIAILFRCLLSGAGIGIPDVQKSLAESLKYFSPTHISLVATQLLELLPKEKANPKLKYFKAILLGGSAMPVSLIERANELGLPIFTSYGSSEMASQITTTSLHDSLEKLKTCGKILANREIKIAADGEILVRGKTLFQGYVIGGTVKSATDEDGWFHTSDLGEFDANGYLRIFGRKDNMFISGGENIFPEEIERALEQLAGVEQALVVPVDDLRFGKRPAAFVKMQEEYSIHDVDWLKLRDMLPGYKIPDFLFEWDKEDKNLKPNRKEWEQRAKELVSSGRGA